MSNLFARFRQWINGFASGAARGDGAADDAESTFDDDWTRGRQSRARRRAQEERAINPATGLPMIGGIGGLDVDGNAYGSSADEDWHDSSSSSDDWHSSSSSSDDWASSSFSDDSWSSTSSNSWD